MNRRFFWKKSGGVLAGLGAMLGMGTAKAQSETSVIDSAVKNGAMTINEARESISVCKSDEVFYLGFSYEPWYTKTFDHDPRVIVNHRAMRSNGTLVDGKSTHWCKDMPAFHVFIGGPVKISHLHGLGVCITI